MPDERNDTRRTNTQHHAAGPTVRKVYRVREVAAILDISREQVFALLRTGELGSILIGKRGRRITDVQLDAYLRSLEGRPPDGPPDAA
jgi:excisionase family DNA binding protein